MGGAVGQQRHVGGGRGRVARARMASTKQGRGGLLTSEPDATAGFKSGQLSQKSFKQNWIQIWNSFKLPLIQKRPFWGLKISNKIWLRRIWIKEQLYPYELLHIQNGFWIKNLGTEGLFLSLGN
jgi:hypothetical protein